MSLVSPILPKNELENFDFCPSLLEQPTGAEIFRLFFGRIENTKVLSKLTDL
jgi:hypothetical protein